MALGHNIKRLREAGGMTQEALATLAGGKVTQGVIAALEKRDSRASQYATAIAAALGVSVQALLSDTPDGELSDTPVDPAQAQVLILDESTVPQTPMDWETVLSVDTLPARFSVAMPDAALEPRIVKGTVLDFMTTTELPPPGTGVLVQDSSGRRYIRRIVEADDGAWLAQARHDAYRSLHSVDDGLQLLAVMTGYRVDSQQA